MNTDVTTDSDGNCTLQAKKIFSLEFDTEPPILCGSRLIVKIKEGGKATGPKLNGITVEPSSDWLTLKANGAIDLNANVVIKTDDGEHIYQHMLGRSLREPDNPANSVLRSSAMFETSAENYKWLNQTILRGHGKKVGSKIYMDYFDT
jgi:hypothetical protein